MGLSTRFRTRQLTRTALALGALVLAAFAVDGARLWHAERINDRISASQVAGAPAIPEADAAGLPELRFAQAHAMAANAGQSDAALNRYRALQGASTLGQAARFNSANLLLRQAILVQASSQPGQAIPLIELAKETYRDILRQQPDHWDARYNLERAQRLLPDPEEGDNEPGEGAKNRERAATTMRGYSPGLP